MAPLCYRSHRFPPLPKIARIAEGGVRSESLFGSGLAGLGTFLSVGRALSDKPRRDVAPSRLLHNVERRIVNLTDPRRLSPAPLG